MRKGRRAILQQSEPAFVLMINENEFQILSFQREFQFTRNANYRYSLN